MMLKVLLCFCLFQVVRSGHWTKIGSDLCIGSKNNGYKEITYSGSDTFIIAMKLVHKKGQIGCGVSRYSYWGCDARLPTGIIVTDTRNKRMYPSPTQVSLRTGGWYDLPGYGHYSSQLVFSDPGFRFLYNGLRMRIWYGEDLFDYTESDNHGFTCIDVHVYEASI